MTPKWSTSKSSTACFCPPCSSRATAAPKCTPRHWSPPPAALRPTSNGSSNIGARPPTIFSFAARPIIAGLFLKCCWQTACRRSATPTNATRSRSTLVRRNSTAASSPATIRLCSALSSTNTPHAFTTRARISGQNATPSGDASSQPNPTRSPTSSSTPARATALCRRCFRRSRPVRSRGSPISSSSIPQRWKKPLPSSMRPCDPAPSTTPSSTIAAPKD